ncbi:hypothetical protein ACJDU8_02405 [Clostridium sp. WILCCON 0269]|uniref:Uncharacterized protein n=1 Tax=Candidatus Clostridium eludens TaxID=3381663 RepID=A0ABW8SEX3_9CLOT
MRVCFYIGIEDLAANALIETLKKGKKRFLTYNEIENYGSRVIQFLNRNGEKAILILSRESTNELFRNYSEYFEEREERGIKGIALKENKKIEDLIEQFRGYLALDVLKAFIDEKSVQVLVS